MTVAPVPLLPSLPLLACQVMGVQHVQTHSCYPHRYLYFLHCMHFGLVYPSAWRLCLCFPLRPSQLCQVVNAQHYLRKLTPAQVTEISRVTAMNPADRKAQCENVSSCVTGQLHKSYGNNPF